MHHGSVFNGDSSLNGGNKEWQEEDAALHAFNMVRMRLKEKSKQNLALMWDQNSPLSWN